MATFINGKTGIIELIDADRNHLNRILRAEATRIATGGKPTLTVRRQEFLLGKLEALSALSVYLSMDDVHVLSEAEFAANPVLAASAGTETSKVCSGCSIPLPEGSQNLCARCRVRCAAN
jgi:hypothetical protein